jgi:hypothetical protein
MPGGKRNNHLAARARSGTGHDQATVRRAREPNDCVLHFRGIAQVDRTYLHAQRRCHGLYGSKLSDAGSKVAIE